jgi:hypothetical protein
MVRFAGLEIIKNSPECFVYINHHTVNEYQQATAQFKSLLIESKPVVAFIES